MTDESWRLLDLMLAPFGGLEYVLAPLTDEQKSAISLAILRLLRGTDEMIQMTEAQLKELLEDTAKSAVTSALERIKLPQANRPAMPEEDEPLRLSDIEPMDVGTPPAFVPAPFPVGKRYSLWYADPPWDYNKQQSTPNTKAYCVATFPTMSTQEICDLPVKDACAEDAILFLWSTCATLIDALRVMASWGFEYKSQLVWVKRRHDPTAPIQCTNGWYFRISHEILLVGTKGRCPPQLVSQHASVLFAPRRKFAQKPDQLYTILERFPLVAQQLSTVPAGTPWTPPPPNDGRIELFARHQRPGWATWGNETPGAATSLTISSSGGEATTARRMAAIGLTRKEIEEAPVLAKAIAETVLLPDEVDESEDPSTPGDRP